MLYGLETVALKKRQDADMELSILVIPNENRNTFNSAKIRNDYIRGTLFAHLLNIIVLR